MKFKSLYQNAKDDVELALINLWAPGHHRMRPVLWNLFSREPLMAEPILESLFPWKTTTDPRWSSYLDSAVIDKLGLSTTVPYTHQAESWKQLQAGNSIVVTSGTGSGKTECFMYPVLSDLYGNIAPDGHDSVQALFLYPLNALMQDQKKRLGECCETLGLKFAVYNSSLRNSTSNITSDYPRAEVMTRERVREYDTGGNVSCPQILLTNPSMLEYMLVRDRDNEIFSRSKGRLKWIIIDEAHTYKGSAAVELAYLIKRVLDAFGVSRDQVRFVCTSATMGDPKQPKELTDFIESLIGQYSTTSHKLVPIGGIREVPSLELNDIDNLLVANGVMETTASRVLSFRDALNREPMQIGKAWNMLTGRNFTPVDTDSALELIDKLCSIKIGNGFLLMTRGHFFMRNVDGLYACVNDGCHCNHEFKKFGFSDLTTIKGNGRCPHCGAPLLELVQCGDCKEFILTCEENAQNQVRPTYNANWGGTESADVDADKDEDKDENKDDSDGGVLVSDNWYRKYYAYYGHDRIYANPHPDYSDCKVGFKWDTVSLTSCDIPPKPWVLLENSDSKSFCPTCASGSGQYGNRFKRFCTSGDWMNGTLAPSLLKETAGIGQEWGKYIAFTDSRQDTAVYAKLFNSNSERSYSRARVADALSQPAPNEASVEAIRSIMAGAGASEEAIQNAIAAVPHTGSKLPVMDLARIADLIYDEQMFKHIDFEAKYRSSNPVTHLSNVDGYKAAMVRGNITRKSIHAADAENIGLIQIVYPKIDNISTIPNTCKTAGITDISEWKNLLKICMDFYMRFENHLQRISPEERQYVRDSDESTPVDPAKWPSVKVNKRNEPSLSQSRMVAIICAGLGIKDISYLKVRRKDVDDILNEVLNTLVRIGLVVKVDANDPYYNVIDKTRNSHKYRDFYYANLSTTSDNCRVRILEKGWICPVNNNIVDTLFMGYSPSIGRRICENNLERFKVTSNPIHLPHLHTQTFNEDIEAIKKEGVWNERIKYALIPTKTAYLTAEHSGQQNREVLDYYTKEFIQGKLNLLQCSTTMEMGVDIGKIQLVLMTNVPPTSANYMQRAGRAGRRGQSEAAAFSICPNTSIGRNAFNTPMTNIVSVNPAIRPVESEIIVQRHANSFFVRRFLTDPSLTARVYFSEVGPWLRTNGFVEQFVRWLDNNKTSGVLIDDFSRIFGHRSIVQSANVSKNAIMTIAREYRQIISNINDEINSAATKAKRNALSFQIASLDHQDLKGYLAENRFLPNADMPTGIVEFNRMDSDTNRELLIKFNSIRQKETELSDPNIDAGIANNLKNEITALRYEIDKLKDSCISSREIRIALSEYAPDQTVVVNEKNYVSAGIEWQNSLGQTNPWKYLYHCDNCGRYEYSGDPTKTQCPDCSGQYRNILFPNSANRFVMAIEPIRFRTDINVSITRKEKTERTYYDIQTILTHVNWTKAQRGPMCELVGSDTAEGEIVFYNPGLASGGFSICMDCGRMEHTRYRLNSTNWRHKPINESSQNYCPVNTVENHVLLAGTFPTSFLSMRFFKNASMKEYVDDTELLNSLGVLLCRALVKIIGISTDDVDFGVRKELNYKSIYIYDTCKGGCGYSTRMLDTRIRNNVFNEAKAMLALYTCNCETNETGACINCLVDRRSQRIEMQLSKFKVMAWFAAQKMNYTPLGSAEAVTMPLQMLAISLAGRPSTKDITFCIDASEMNLLDWIHKEGVMGRILEEMTNRRNINVRLLISGIPSVSDGATSEQIYPFVDLESKFANWGIVVEAVDSIESVPGKFSALIVNNNDHYFTTQKDVLPFNEKWGLNCTALYEEANIPSFMKVSVPTLADVPSVISQDEIIRSCIISDTRTTLAALFADVLCPKLLKDNDDNDIRTILSGKSVDVMFSDSYVNSALAALMLVYFIKNVKDVYGFQINKVELKVNGPKRKCDNSSWSLNDYIGYNFDDQRNADEFIKKLFVDILGVTPIFSNMVPDHCRWLKFTPSGAVGNIEFRPDFGVAGGWQSSETYRSLQWIDENMVIDTKRRTRIVYYLFINKR